MGIFDKCSAFTEARQAQAQGIYPYFVPMEATTPTRARVAGKWKLMMGSNAYLGLTHHPRVVEAAQRAMAEFGGGSTGSRLLNGNSVAIEALEEELADFLGKPAAAVFPTGYSANVGTVSALAGRGDHLFLDRGNHASLTDGARLALAQVHRYPHGDMAALGALLQREQAGENALVVTDGVFSMDGTVVDLPALLGETAPRGATVMVDDAHGLGVLGSTGAGTAEHFGLTDQVDVIVATFSKSLGSIGGVAAGEVEVMHYLKHRARSLLFSASMPPASVAGVRAALSVLRSEPDLRERLQDNARWLRNALEGEGLSVGGADTPILPIFVGDYQRVLRFWRALFDRGAYVNAVVPPGVPATSSRLRVSVTAAHTREELERFVELVCEVQAALPPTMGERSRKDPQPPASVPVL
ncbi:MAG: aminotransferase class I/II-fold pyridoxal phosphate-dependent enzyme [Gemmatimonadota bacterium]